MFEVNLYYRKVAVCHFALKAALTWHTSMTYIYARVKAALVTTIL
jgi:hypothetical protein